MDKSELEKFAESPMENDDGSITEIRIEIGRTKPDGSWYSDTYVISGAGKLGIFRATEVSK